MFKRLSVVLIAMSLIVVAGLVILAVQSNSSVAQENDLAPAQQSTEVPIQVGNRSITRKNIGKGTALPPSQPLKVPAGVQGFNASGRLQWPGHGNNAANRGYRSSPPQIEMKPLLRATYMLPSDAAEAMGTLFAHKATTLVESQIETANDETPGLAKFIVTAEPDTQQAIRAFILSVFPDANVKKYVAQQTSLKSKLSDSKFQTVSLKLPGMT